jgi:hypothetical protein
MQRWTSFALRTGFIVGFLIVLPVIAMPKVAALLDQLLYGESKSTLPSVASEKDLSSPHPSPGPGQANAQPAALDVPRVAKNARLLESPERSSLGRRLQPPPTMAPSADFVRQAGNSEPERRPVEPASDVGPLDEATAARIDVIRGRLEELGAQYVRLEMSADGREFHCLCHMLVGNDPSNLQPFEAMRTDPVDAAQAVLTSVEAWRTAERTPAPSPRSGPETRPR